MTSILISSDDEKTGENIAERAAKAVGYKLVDRSILSDVAKRHEVPEKELRAALDVNAPRSLSKKRRDALLAYIQAATLEALAKDDVVCAGLAAHLYVTGVSHVLLLRALTDTEARVVSLAAEKKVTPRKARKVLERDRASRIRWSTGAYGVNEYDANLYDIVVRMTRIDAEKVVQIMRDTIGCRGFEPMTYSRKCLDDLVLASRARAVLLSTFPEIRVTADGSRVIVHVRCSKRQKPRIVQGIKEIAGKVPGVDLVEVHAVSSFRDPEPERGAAAPQNGTIV